MKKILEKFNLQNFEQMIATIHSALPHLPHAASLYVVKLMPYIALIWGILFVVSGLLPSSAGLGAAFFVNVKSGFILNGLLIRVASILTGLILFFAFRPLKLHMQKGWDSLWFVSIFQIFFGLLFIRISTFAFVFVLWYVLFEIKKEYSAKL